MQVVMVIRLFITLAEEAMNSVYLYCLKQVGALEHSWR